MGETKGTGGELLLRDCAQVSISTGHSATTLRELRELLATVPPASIYHHFWGRLLQPQFDEPEYNNDFASWAHRSLHDKTLAERLSAINPSEYGSIEEVRAELIDDIELRLDESDLLAWRQTDHAFYFSRAQMVVFDTQHRLRDPRELARVIEHVSNGVIFYHFIDARQRTEEHADDFSLWLRGFGEQHAALADELVAIDPYFSSLHGLRRTLIRTLEKHTEGGTDGHVSAGNA